MCVHRHPQRPEEVSGPLELGLQTVVSRHVGAGNQPGALWKAVFLISESSFWSPRFYAASFCFFEPGSHYVAFADLELPCRLDWSSYSSTLTLPRLIFSPSEKTGMMGPCRHVQLLGFLPGSTHNKSLPCHQSHFAKTWAARSQLLTEKPACIIFLPLFCLLNGIICPTGWYNRHISSWHYRLRMQMRKVKKKKMIHITKDT